MASLRIENVSVVLETKTITDGYVTVKDGRIASVGEGKPSAPCETVIDGGGGVLCPGFIDLHSHGGGDHDNMDGTAEDIILSARAHLRRGTTTYAPTTLTSSDRELFDFFDHYHEAAKVTENMPRLCGVHLEGPYFNPAQAGAQPPEYIVPPRKAHYEEILRRGGDIMMRWSIAPELEGALALGDVLRERGIIASIGHSDADYETVKAAVAHGYTHVTHLYSGMSTITRRKGHRILGVVECAYLFDELHAEIIADGIHLPPELLRMIVKTLPADRLSLVTDSMRGAGMPEGPSILGSRAHGVPVIIQGGIANMPDASGFAGSVATTDRLFRTMVQSAGLPLHEAARLASLNPARLIHRDGETGSIKEGKLADLVLLTKDLYARRVWVGGNEITA